MREDGTGISIPTGHPFHTPISCTSGSRELNEGSPNVDRDSSASGGGSVPVPAPAEKGVLVCFYRAAFCRFFFGGGGAGGRRLPLAGSQELGFV